ncbi:MAG: hypothetical protein WBB19_08480 [Desulforhopalus sp.]
MKGDDRLGLNDLEDVDAGTGLKPPHGGKKENAAHRKQNRAPDVTCNRRYFKNLISIVMTYCSPMKANFKEIMNGNDKIEQ